MSAEKSGRYLTRREMIDSRSFVYKGVPMNKHQYEAYRNLGYGDGRTWDEWVFELYPHLASEDVFRKTYPNNPL